MVKVSLTIKDGNTKTNEQFEISEIIGMQALRLNSEIGLIMKEIKGNGEVKGMLETILSDVDITADQSGDEMTDKLEALKDERFVNSLADAFDVLIQTVPERAFNLLAITSDIPRETLERVTIVELMDVYDAVVEVNDIPALVERAQKSFFGTKDKWAKGFSRLFNKKQK